jgi:TatA/E family protein of Tat protein translocase
MIPKRLTLFTGGLEIGLLLFVAFLLFGPKKLPEIARTLGKGMAELRRASNELKSSLEEEIRNLDRIPEDHLTGRGEELAGPAAKYGDHHSEPAPDDAASRQ